MHPTGRSVTHRQPLLALMLVDGVLKIAYFDIEVRYMLQHTHSKRIVPLLIQQKS